MNEKIILDTIISNNHIDKSHILKIVDLDNKNKSTLTIKINNKIRIIEIFDSIRGCVDVLSSYDDHSLIYQRASEIENRKINKGLEVDFKQIVDSLRKSSTIGFYDKIEVDVKTKNCK